MNLNNKGVGIALENSRRKWLEFKEGCRTKAPKKPPIPAYKLSLTHKQSFRPLEDMIYVVEEEPRLCIHGLKAVTVDTLKSGKMLVKVHCDESAEKREAVDLKVENLREMEIYWPMLNKNFGRKTFYWQYEIDKYADFTDFKDSYLSTGLSLGMEYIEKICEILDGHGYKEEKSYKCLQLVDDLKDGLEFTPEVVFGQMEEGKSQLKFLDSIGVFLTRKNLKPIDYTIDRMYLKNKWFRLESLAKRRGYTVVHEDKKRKTMLKFT